MKTHLVELSWLDNREAITLSQLSEVSAMTTDELDELVDYGALMPIQRADHERFFGSM